MAATGMVLGAAYALWLYRRVIFGVLIKPRLKSLSDLNWREKLVFAPLVAGVLIFGIYPMPLLTMMEASVANVIDQYNLALESDTGGLIDPNKSLEIAL